MAIVISPSKRIISSIEFAACVCGRPRNCATIVKYSLPLKWV